MPHCDLDSISEKSNSSDRIEEPQDPQPSRSPPRIPLSEIPTDDNIKPTPAGKRASSRRSSFSSYASLTPVRRSARLQQKNERRTSQSPMQ